MDALARLGVDSLRRDPAADLMTALDLRQTTQIPPRSAGFGPYGEPSRQPPIDDGMEAIRAGIMRYVGTR